MFARERYAGNQLAVVESDGDLSDAEMHTVAAGMDYSETIFIESDASPYRVCIFTPEAEIPFAGHPTLGTAAVIREEIADRAPDEVVLDLNVGEVPVRMDENGETLWMTQQPPEFGEQLAHDRLSAVLGLDGSARDAD